MQSAQCGVARDAHAGDSAADYNQVKQASILRRVCRTHLSDPQKNAVNAGRYGQLTRWVSGITVTA